MELKRVFISHAHDDRELAGYVREMLQAALALSDDEIVCTGDGQYGLPPGADLKQELTARLQSTRALFLLATPAARGKEWVNYECGVASQLKEEHRLEFITLIPTATDIDAVPAPYRHAISVVLSEGDQIRSLVDHIRTSLGAPVTPNDNYVRPMKLQHLGDGIGQRGRQPDEHAPRLQQRQGRVEQLGEHSLVARLIAPANQELLTTGVEQRAQALVLNRLEDPRRRPRRRQHREDERETLLDVRLVIIGRRQALVQQHA